METEEREDSAEEIRNIESQPTCLRDDKLGLAEIRNEMSEISQILAYCYDKWWSRMDDRRLIGLDKSGVTISNERPFVVHNSAVINGGEVAVDVPTVSCNSGGISTVGFKDELAAVDSSTNHAGVVKRISLPPPKPTVLNRPMYTCYYCNSGRKSVTSLRSHIRKRHHRLYRCYNKWWRQPEDKQLNGLDKSGVTINEQMPFVVHNSAVRLNKFDGRVDGPVVNGSEMESVTPVAFNAVAFNGGGIIVGTKSRDPPISVSGGGIIETESTTPPIAINSGRNIETKSSTPPIAFDSGGIFVETKSCSEPMAVHNREIIVETKSSTATAAVNGGGMLIETKSSTAPVAVSGGEIFVETKPTSPPIAVNNGGIVETKSSPAPIAVNGGGIMETKSTSSPIAVNNRGIIVETKSSTAPTAVDGGMLIETKPSIPPIDVNNGGITVKTESTTPIAVNGRGIIVSIPIVSLNNPEITVNAPPAVLKEGVPIINNVVPLNKKMASSFTPNVAINKTSVPPKIIVKSASLNRPQLTCYYCNRTRRSVSSLRGHMKKRHHQLFRCVPIVVLDRIEVGKEDKKMNNFLNKRCTKRWSRRNCKKMICLDKSRVPISIELPIAVQNSTVAQDKCEAVAVGGEFVVDSPTVSRGNGKMAANLRTEILNLEGEAVDHCIYPVVTKKKIVAPPGEKIIPNPAAASHPTVECYYCNRSRKSVTSLKAHIKKRHHQLYRCYDEWRRTNNNHLVGLYEPGTAISNKRPFVVCNTAVALSETGSGVINDKTKSATFPIVVNGGGINVETSSTTPPIAVTSGGILIETKSTNPPVVVHSGRIVETKSTTPIAVNDGGILVETKSTTPPIVVTSGGIVGTKSTTSPIAVNDGGILVVTKSTNPAIAVNDGGIHVETKSTNPPISVNGELKSTVPPNAVYSRGIIVSIPIVPFNNGDLKEGVSNDIAVPPDKTSVPNMSPVVAVKRIALPPTEKVIAKHKAVNRPMFTCYYCNRSKKSVRSLRAHIRKHHHQLFKAVPVVVLDRIEIGKENKKINNISNNCPSALGHCTYTECETWIPPGTSCQATKPPAAGVYHCADCNHSSHTRQDMKVHIFTRHVYKRLCLDYSLQRASELASKYFVRNQCDQEHVYNICKKAGLASGNLNTKKQLDSQDYPAKSKYSRWYEEVKAELARDGSRESERLVCSCCRVAWLSLEHLHHHLSLLHRQLCRSFPLVRLERGYPRSGSHCVGSCCMRNALGGVQDLYSCRCFYCDLRWPPLPGIDSHCIVKARHQLFKYFPVVSLERIDIEEEIRKLRHIGNPSHSANPSNGGCTGIKRRVYQCAECVYSVRSRKEMKVHIFTRHVYKKLWLSYTSRYPPCSSSALSNVKLEPPSWPGENAPPFSPETNSQPSTSHLGIWKCELIKDESYGDTDDDKMFACVYCEEDCETWQELKTHIAESHHELCSVTGFPDDFDMKWETSLVKMKLRHTTPPGKEEWSTAILVHEWISVHSCLISKLS